MEYRWVLDYRLWLLVLPIVWRCPDIVIAQTEGDTGYEYPEAYEEDYEESVLGVEPSFDVPIVNITVVAGQTAVLPCSIDALGKYKVAWLDQKNMALTFDDRRYVDDFRFAVVRPEPKEWNLQIRDVRWEDQGQYRCTINTEPGKSKSVVLHVKVPAQIVDELSSNDVRVQEGETVVLVCNVTGVPHPEVTWYRRPVTSGLHDRERIGHSGEVIIIQNVSRYCDDMYECVADNGVPPAVSRQMRVTVEFAPEIVMPNKRIGQDLTRDTILECMITAYPHAQNRWMKDGMEIKSQSGKYRIQPYDDGDHTITLSLSIYDISDKDYGEYSCQASNLLGSDKESMLLFQNPTLEVQPPEKPVVGGGTYKPARPTQAVPKYTVTKDASKNNNKHNNIDKLRMEQWKIENGAPSMKGSSCSLLAAMLVAVLSSIVL